MGIEYSSDMQKGLLEYMIASEESFVRCRNILKSYYFERKLQPAVKYILEYADEYQAMPSTKQIKDYTEIDLDIISKDNISDQHNKWFLDEIESFCRHKEIENVVESGPDLLSKGNYEVLESRIKEAVLIGLQKDLGFDFFANPALAVETLKERNNMTSTGWQTLDKKLYGGINRSELTLFCGGPGSGKSLFLQNISINLAAQGHNVLYFTFELSEELVAVRFNAMIAGTTTRDVFQNSLSVGQKVKQQYAEKKWGKIQIKYMPSGTSANDLKAYIKEYQIQTGVTPDAIVVDYLDLMYPNNKRINPTDAFAKDKFVSEELRSLAAEFKTFAVSASQLNRSSFEEQDHGMQHVAGGISKINTADNAITIFSSDALKERGEIRLQLIKTRSSSGVGSKIELAFDQNSLRITDQDALEQDAKIQKTKIDLGDQLRRRNEQKEKIEKDDTVPKEDKPVNANNLRDLINRTSRK